MREILGDRRLHVTRFRDGLTNFGFRGLSVIGSRSFFKTWSHCFYTIQRCYFSDVICCAYAVILSENPLTVKLLISLVSEDCLHLLQIFTGIDLLNTVFDFIFVSAEQPLNESFQGGAFLHWFILNLLRWSTKERMSLYFINRETWVVVHLKDLLDQVFKFRAQRHVLWERILEGFNSADCLLKAFWLKWTDAKFHSVEYNPKWPDIGWEGVTKATSNLRW